MDKIEIKAKLSYLKELIEKIEIRLEKYPNEKDDFLKENLYVSISKFSEEVVEVAISINNILLEDKKDYAPSYYETFTKLKKHYPFEDSFLEKIANTAGFRNRLVHQYSQIDEKIAYASFENLVNLYKIYIKEIKKLL